MVGAVQILILEGKLIEMFKQINMVKNILDAKKKKLYRAAKSSGLEAPENFVDYGGIDGSTLYATVFDDEASGGIHSGTSPYLGSYQPVGSLSAIDGESITGTWTLVVNNTSNYSGYNVRCKGENSAWIELTVSGGYPPYSYQWNNGNVSDSVFNLYAGNYSVIITDGLGCIENISIS